MGWSGLSGGVFGVLEFWFSECVWRAIAVLGDVGVWGIQFFLLYEI